MTWAARLRDKTTGAEAALDAVASGQRVFIHGAAATPRTLGQAFTARAADLRDVEPVSIHTRGPAPCWPRRTPIADGRRSMRASRASPAT